MEPPKWFLALTACGWYVKDHSPVGSAEVTGITLNSYYLSSSQSSRGHKLVHLT